MSDLNVARLTNKLRSLFTLRGQQPVAPEVEDSIMPVVVMEAERAEHFFLAGEVLWGIQRTVAALAGNFSFVGVRNRAAAGIVTVVLGIRANSGAAAGFAAVLNTETAIGADGLVFTRDTRQFTQIPGTRRFDGQQVAGIGGNTMEVTFSPAGAEHNFRSPPFVLGPGTELVVVPTAVNVQADVTIWGYERSIEKSELA